MSREFFLYSTYRQKLLTSIGGDTNDRLLHWLRNFDILHIEFFIKFTFKLMLYRSRTYDGRLCRRNGQNSCDFSVDDASICDCFCWSESNLWISKARGWKQRIQLFVRISIFNIIFFIFVSLIFHYFLLFKRYQQSDGEISIGQTIFIFKLQHKAFNNDTRFYHFVIDENGAVYWVSFSENESNSTSTFSKALHPGMKILFHFNSKKILFSDYYVILRW